MINGISANINSLKNKSVGHTNDANDNEKKISAQNKKDIEDITFQNKIAQIKESIENKDYQIDLRKTSEKMALDLLNL